MILKLRNSLYGKEKTVAFVIAVVCLIMTFALSSCGGISAPPSESKIKDHLSDDFFTIIIDGETVQLELSDLEIEKRQTNEKQDIAYCRIKMSNTFYTYEATYCMIFNYYDQGGWILDGYSIEGDSSVISTGGMGPESDEKIDRYLNNYFSDYKLLSDEFDGETHVFEYEITESTSKYLAYSGTVTVAARFSSEGNAGKWEIINSFGPYCDNLNFDWDIFGSWDSDIIDSGYEINLGIIGVIDHDSIGMSSTGIVRYDGYRPVYLSNSNIVNHKIPISWKEVDGRNILCVNFTVYGNYPEEIEVWIYPDYAKCKYINHDISELVKIS